MCAADWPPPLSGRAPETWSSLRALRDTARPFSPSPEAGAPAGKVWLLNKCVYGLQDASRNFYLAYADALLDYGMEVVKMDPALFVYHKDNSTIKSEVRKLSGILSTHVDDSLATGSPSFKAEVEKRILQKFTSINGPL